MRQKFSSRNHSLFIVFLLVVLVVGVTGCSSMTYYGQALAGHLDLTMKRKKIDHLLTSEQTPVELRARLERVQDIRHYAVAELGLPDSGSYTDYADLGRDVTVWLLTAVPEFSMKPRQWCYPFVGCLNYRGFFDRADAEAEAVALQAEGYETSVAPGTAYSTLGFMDDPVLNTMLRYDDSRLAGVLFHELAHERVFIKGDGRFNESFASAVEKLGRERYMQARDLPLDLEAEALADTRQKAFTELLLAGRSALDRLYRSGGDRDHLQAEKDRILADLTDRYQAFCDQWDGYRGYDRWFRHGAPNNAQLALLATYESAVPAFEALFAEAGRDFEAFYRMAESMAELPKATRWTRIASLERKYTEQQLAKAQP